VFSRFYRADNAQTAAHGLGIGLYFARELAERVGARLTVESREGQGSKFSLRLPARTPNGGDA
jgi:signal transduction histidine kinase